jgi:sulfite oxidase
MTSLPLNSTVSSIVPTSDNSLIVKGYAIPSAGTQVASVDVSDDGGNIWKSARIVYQTGKWSWTIWEIDLKVDRSLMEVEVFSRATDSEGHVQPKESAWNLRGVAYNAWGRGKWIR